MKYWVRSLVKCLRICGQKGNSNQIIDLYYSSVLQESQAVSIAKSIMDVITSNRINNAVIMPRSYSNNLIFSTSLQLELGLTKICTEKALLRIK